MKKSTIEGMTFYTITMEEYRLQKMRRATAYMRAGISKYITLWSMFLALSIPLVASQFA